jgi:hypothetical protein
MARQSRAIKNRKTISGGASRRHLWFKFLKASLRLAFKNLIVRIAICDAEDWLFLHKSR